MAQRRDILNRARDQLEHVISSFDAAIYKSSYMGEQLTLLKKAHNDISLVLAEPPVYAEELV